MLILSICVALGFVVRVGLGWGVSVLLRRLTGGEEGGREAVMSRLAAFAVVSFVGEETGCVKYSIGS